MALTAIEWIYLVIGGTVLWIIYCIDLYLIQEWLFRLIKDSKIKRQKS